MTIREDAEPFHVFAVVILGETCDVTEKDNRFVEKMCSPRIRYLYKDLASLFWITENFCGQKVRPARMEPGAKRRFPKSL